MKIYKIDSLYYTAGKMMRHLRSLNAQVTDWNGNTYAVRDLDDDRLMGIIEWGNRHEYTRTDRWAGGTAPRPCRWGKDYHC